MRTYKPVDQEMIDNAVAQLFDAAPGSRVILFGSHARGTARPDSDLDLLVIEPVVSDRFGEMNRLARLLGERMIPADVIVLSAPDFERQSKITNTLAWRANREGKVYERS